MNNQNPKIVVIGAGSLFFGRQLIWAVNQLSGLQSCRLSLVDTDPDHLSSMVRLAELAARHQGTAVTVEGHHDYRDALPEADFVVLSFSDRNAHFRGVDCRISAKYGIRMCSGDTIGPGGVFRAARELPKLLEIGHAVEEICPDAWLINYVNPSAVIGIAFMRHLRVRNFALCDSHHLPYKKIDYLKMIGENPGDHPQFDLRIAGVNHFTFMLKAELKGENVYPRIHRAFHELAKSEKDEGHSKGRFNNFITAQFGDVFGALPTCTGHTKEYVPYYQGRSSIHEPIAPLTIFDSEARAKQTDEMWAEINEYVSGKREMAAFFEKYKSDHATDIIHTMIAGDGRNYYINVPNQADAKGNLPVPNLPSDAFLELECQVDANGPRPLPAGNMPIGLRALQMQILDCHELTVQAIVKKDRRLLRRALAMDPLIHSIATADAVIEDLMEAQADVLGDWPEITDPTAGTQLVSATNPGYAPQLF